MNIPSLAFNLKSYNPEELYTNVQFQNKKEQSQKILSINQLRLKLSSLMGNFNIDQNFVNVTDEMVNLPTLKSMNMSYLAGALLFLNSINEEGPTPENFNSEYTQRIIKAIYNQNDMVIENSEYTQLYNYIFTVYLYRYNNEINRYKSQIYEKLGDQINSDIINQINNLNKEELINYLSILRNQQ
jgi:hypothetical protein